MKYKITKAEIANDWLYETMSALYSCLQTHGVPIYVVGARARDFAMIIMHENPSPQHTEDLDIAIALPDWSKYEAIAKTLVENNFHREKSSQKFYYKGPEHQLDFMVDVVPFGEVAEDEKVKWPPEGNPELSVRCFDDIMSHADDVEVDGAFTVKIAPICGQFMIKLDTWNDRNDRTDKDVADLLFFMKNYFNIRQAELFLDLPDDIEIPEEESPIFSGAKLIAYDASKMLTTPHLQFFYNLLEEEYVAEDNSKLTIHMATYRGNSVDNDYAVVFEECRELIGTIRDIFKQELDKR